ncbi:DUF4274 domain-containing protein [Fusobacterium sp. SYSU M8D902]|uniref:DUF4274 domain-containing protein n=1 Tax=Fusobacterium sp. SYSU M8D902 TaxID=3159562 RepID=UPI0032E4FD30
MLKVEDILRGDFDWENLEIDDDEFDEIETELIIDYLKKNSPKERQLLAIDWNFDNSKEVIKWIAEQEDTDRGTALFLYWYMNPQDFKKYKDREEWEENDSWALEDFDIVETLEKNYISGFYKNQKYAFNPKNDVYSGYDWTKEVDESDMKAEIPKEMYIALDGEVLESPNWGEGIPDEIIPILDKLYEALDEE